jgi:ubiquinone/menaquinone biosynthesis C-methylase UbiE
LAIRTKPEWDARIVAQLLELLPRVGRVLDVGCGYGRIAVPIARAGFAVTGLDISPNLLRAARREAVRHHVAVAFDRGSMTSLPYPDVSFDAVICLWTSFHELIDDAEQVAALGEMHRVLAPGGIAIIEGPTFEPAAAADILSGARTGPEHRVVVGSISGRRIETFAHNNASLLGLAERIGSRRAEVVVRDWGGRARQLLILGREVSVAPAWSAATAKTTAPR